MSLSGLVSIVDRKSLNIEHEGPASPLHALLSLVFLEHVSFIKDTLWLLGDDVAWGFAGARRWPFID
jgi:hypothetical protein